MTEHNTVVDRGTRPVVRRPAILLEGVSKIYRSKGNGTQNSLINVDLRIDEGEFVFVTGDSGAGKSTLLRLILREIRPNSGVIVVNGHDLHRMRRREIPYYRRGIGMVFQDFRLLPDRNIYENVAFALRAMEKPESEIMMRVPELLLSVGLYEKQKAYPGELSGGEKQRAALARALANKPELLLADEPTGNLDERNAEAVMNLLAEVNSSGTTVLMVTHNRSIIEHRPRRVITLAEGRIASDSRDAMRKGGLA